MGEQIKVKIPEKYYAYGMPKRTNYFGEDNKGLAYTPSPEQQFELEAAFGGPGQSVISLLSPYILGFDFPYEASQLKLVHADIKKREVVVEVINA